MEKIHFIFLLLLFFLFSACERVVDIDIQSYEAALIVEGGILHQMNGPNTPQQIRLSQTVDFLNQNGAEPVTEAVVRVNDGTQHFDFRHQGNGLYTAEMSTTIGRTYQLEIEYNGQMITAEEKLVSVPLIDSIYTNYEEETTFTDAGYFVQINTKDEPGVRNFYHWRVYIDGQLTIVPDPGNSVNLIAQDEFFDGQVLNGLKPNEEVILEPGDLVRVEQLGISEGYHNYLFQVFEQTGLTPLLGDPPPARIQGNLIDQKDKTRFVLGYFTVASQSEAETIVVE